MIFRVFNQTNISDFHWNFFLEVSCLKFFRFSKNKYLTNTFCVFQNFASKTKKDLSNKMNSTFYLLIGIVLFLNISSYQTSGQYVPIEIDEDSDSRLEQILKDENDNQIVDGFEIKKKPSWAVGRSLDKRIIEFKRHSMDYEKIAKLSKLLARSAH